MQHGCMERLNRKRGPEVWQFRWSVIGPDAKRLYHKKIVGTVERYADENAARRAIVGWSWKSTPMAEQRIVAR
jgi:integrase